MRSMGVADGAAWRLAKDPTRYGPGIDDDHPWPVGLPILACLILGQWHDSGALRPIGARLSQLRRIELPPLVWNVAGKRFLTRGTHPAREG